MRHRYKLVLKNGEEVIMDDYQMVKAYWYKCRDMMDHVVVLDV